MSIVWGIISLMRTIESEKSDLIWSRKTGRAALRQQPDSHSASTNLDMLPVEIIRPVSAFIGGLAASYPTFYFAKRLIELIR